VGNGEGIGETLGAAVVGDEVVGTRVGSRQHPFSVRVTSSEGSEAPAAFSATTVNVTVEKQATFSSSAKLSVSAVRRRQPFFASHSLLEPSRLNPSVSPCVRFRLWRSRLFARASRLLLNLRSAESTATANTSPSYNK
jgi:hypothetical protein